MCARAIVSCRLQRNSRPNETPITSPATLLTSSLDADIDDPIERLQASRRHPDCGLHGDLQPVVESFPRRARGPARLLPIRGRLLVLRGLLLIRLLFRGVRLALRARRLPLLLLLLLLLSQRHLVGLTGSLFLWFQGSRTPHRPLWFRQFFYFLYLRHLVQDVLPVMPQEDGLDALRVGHHAAGKESRLPSIHPVLCACVSVLGGGARVW